MAGTRIAGSGFFVPERVVTNDELSKLMNTNDEWIVTRTGIKERRYVDEGMTGAEMGGYAAEEAMDAAGLEPGDIDAILYATLSPDYYWPCNAVMLQQEIGLYDVPTYDIRNQCTGFLYGMSMADQFIRAGIYKNVLLVGGEIHSTGLEFADRGRDVSVIFGDGAGAMVISPEERDGYGLLTAHLHGDGAAGAELLWTDCEGSIYHPRLTQDMVDDGSIYPQMKGKRVFMEAVRRLPEVINATLEEQKLSKDDIKCWLFHQANARINEFTLNALEVPLERAYNNIEIYGNTTGATLPGVYHEAKAAGRFGDGDYLMFASFGAGYTWGTVLVRM